MKNVEEELKSLEALCKITVRGEEREKLYSNLTRVLQYVEKLQELDTRHVKPLVLVHEGSSAPLRSDEPLDVMDRATFLKMIPDRIGTMVKVPPVMKDEL